MNKRTCFGFLCIFGFMFEVLAGPRASSSFTLATDFFDSGGGRMTSASYTNNCSVGGISGTSSVASPAETMKSGYLGQLYEVAAVQVTASPTTLNEATAKQLVATATLDDGTTLAALANSVVWSVANGPINTISTSGLTTAGNVYQNTAATVQANYFGSSGTLVLTVVNVSSDDLGIYASDGIDDSWQVQYFGLNNPKATPTVFSDGSGFNNLFKYTAGLVPNSNASKLIVTTMPVGGQPLQCNISVTPTFMDRHYTLQFSTDLKTWNILSGPSVGNGATMNLKDTSVGSARFYRVNITKP